MTTSNDVCVHAKSLQLHPVICNTMDCSLPGSSVLGILQARILEWVIMPSSSDLPDPGIKPKSLTSHELARGFFITSTSWEAPSNDVSNDNCIVTWKRVAEEGGEQEPGREYLKDLLYSH